MEYDELVQRLHITRSYLANHPTHGSWEEANVVEQAADAITKLRAERDFAMEMVNVQDNKIDKLLGERDALAADAARYRWLRGNGVIFERTAPGHLFDYGIGLDAAIDAALAGDKP